MGVAEFSFTVLAVAVLSYLLPLRAAPSKYRLVALRVRPRIVRGS